MEVRVLLFGPFADAAGCNHRCVTVPDKATCAEVLAALSAVPGPLGAMVSGGSARLAVNHTFAIGSRHLEPGDEVALIGLVSGG